MWITLPGRRMQWPGPSPREALLSLDEEEGLLRYRTIRTMSGAIEEAARTADAMFRLELSLSLQRDGGAA